METNKYKPLIMAVMALLFLVLAVFAQIQTSRLMHKLLDAQDRAMRRQTHTIELQEQVIERQNESIHNLLAIQASQANALQSLHGLVMASTELQMKQRQLEQLTQQRLSRLEWRTGTTGTMQ